MNYRKLCLSLSTYNHIDVKADNHTEHHAGLAPAVARRDNVYPVGRQLLPAVALRAGRTGATVDKFEGRFWIDRCADAWSATDVRPHRQTTRAEHQLYTPHRHEERQANVMAQGNGHADCP